MSTVQDFLKLSGFVNGIVDRKIRAIALGVTTSTGYFKSLIAQASGYATAAQGSSTAAQTSAAAADASSTGATLVYNAFTATYLGYLAADPQRSSSGNIVNRGAWYVNNASLHLRVASSVNSSTGVVTWSDALVSADPASVIAAGAGNFLSLTQNTATAQVVAGKVTFSSTVLAPRVTDWTTQQVATAVDVSSLTNALSSALTSEVTRAQAAETANANALTVEINRAKAAENTNAGNITAETTRAQNAEGTLSSAIAVETNRAKGVENNLQTSINNEQTRAQGAEGSISAAVSAETSRAQGAEGSISSSVTTEVNRAKAAEATLQGNIGAEQTRAQNSEGSIAASVTQLRSDAGQWNTDRYNQTNGWNNDRYNQTVGVQNNLNAEVSRAQSAEASLAASVTQARSDLVGYTNGQVGGVQGNLNNEISRAQGAEGSIAASVTQLRNDAGGWNNDRYNQANGVQNNLNNFTNQFFFGTNQYGAVEYRANGVREMWGLVTLPANYQTNNGSTFNFPLPFTTTDSMVLTGNMRSAVSGTWSEAVIRFPGGLSTTQFYMTAGTSNQNQTFYQDTTFFWHCIGH